MVAILPPKTNIGSLIGQGLGSGIAQAGSQAADQQYQRGQLEQQLGKARKIFEDPNATFEQKQLGLYQALIGRPDIAKQMMDQIAQHQETQGKQAKTSYDREQNLALVRSIEKERNLPPGSGDSYVSNPRLFEQITRPPKEPKKTQASQPIDPDQLNKIQQVRRMPGFDQMDEVEQYRAFTDAGVSKENAESESKLTGQKLERLQKTVDSSYKAQEDFINKTTDSYKAFETEMKPRLLQMQKIATDEQLISPTAAVFLDALGIPLGALDDPSSELYQKLSLDLLKGLPETFGNRIMKVEVDNFLKTIPQLINSPDGRRMIASNMLKLGEMKEIYYNEMRSQQKELIDTAKPFPRDFQQRVFDQVKPQIDKVNNEFVKLSEIRSVPKDTVPFFNPNGDIEFVPKEHAQWASENGGKRIW